MTNTIQTANHIAKLVLSTGVIVCYLYGLIDGPFATALVILASLVVAISIAQVIIVKFIRD